MIRVLRNRKRAIALCIALTYGLNVFAPGVSYALTSGPTQPEVLAFQPAGTNDTGQTCSRAISRTTYRCWNCRGQTAAIRLTSPIRSGGTMDQESSWVGFGWSLNPGTINRQMRGTAG